MNVYRTPSPPPCEEPETESKPKPPGRFARACGAVFKLLVGAALLAAAYLIVQRLGVVIGTCAFGTPPQNASDRYVAAPIITFFALAALVALVGAGWFCYRIGDALVKRLL